MSQQALDKCCRVGTVLGVRNTYGRWMYPLAQFHMVRGHNEFQPSLRDVLEILLSAADGLVVASWLMTRIGVSMAGNRGKHLALGVRRARLRVRPKPKRRSGARDVSVRHPFVDLTQFPTSTLEVGTAVWRITGESRQENPVLFSASGNGRFDLNARLISGW